MDRLLENGEKLRYAFRTQVEWLAAIDVLEGRLANNKGDPILIIELIGVFKECFFLTKVKKNKRGKYKKGKNR